MEEMCKIYNDFLQGLTLYYVYVFYFVFIGMVIWDQ